jgi:predicted amidohydrolase
VFDESRYFQPVTQQNVFVFGDQNLGITVCKDFWSDKTFWMKPLYERGPVAELVAKSASLIVSLCRNTFH